MAYRLEELKNAKILKTELNERVSRYIHLELKNITIDENKFPLLAKKRIVAITAYFYHLLLRCGAYSRAALINFSTPCAARNRGQRLFGGGAYSSKYGI